MTPEAGTHGKANSNSRLVQNASFTTGAHVVHGREEIMANLRTKEKLPPSYDSSPGAFAIQGTRAPHRPDIASLHDTLSPPRHCHIDEGKLEKEVAAPEAETEGKI